MNRIAALLAALLSLLVAPFFFSDPPCNGDVSDLPDVVQAWHGRGQYVTIRGFKFFFIHEKRRGEARPTFVILHGFPSSSYEYHKVLERLLAFGDVFIHDQLGFGFSDKPAQNFTYSIAEAADNSLIIWKKMGLKNAHVVAHDMGDTILTEILARRHRGLLPSYFDDFFLSVTFTNGGMRYSHINFRVGQSLLSNVYLGSYFCKLANRFGFSNLFTKRQLASIWGPIIDSKTREQDIEAIESLYRFNGGSLISHKTIYYLWDRAHFEFRWFEALSQLDIPTRFIWGDADAVSPIAIPKFLKTLLPAADMIFLEGSGHFLMLEFPEKWVNLISKVAQ